MKHEWTETLSGDTMRHVIEQDGDFFHIRTHHSVQPRDAHSEARENVFCRRIFTLAAQVAAVEAENDALRHALPDVALSDLVRRLEAENAKLRSEKPTLKVDHPFAFARLLAVTPMPDDLAADPVALGAEVVEHQTREGLRFDLLGEDGKVARSVEASWAEMRDLGDRNVLLRRLFHPTASPASPEPEPDHSEEPSP
jgi:hypothetical protein